MTPTPVSPEKEMSETVIEIEVKAQIELTREDGAAICAFFNEFWARDELSEDERALYFRVIAAGDYGRPVPPHASGGGAR